MSNGGTEAPATWATPGAERNPASVIEHADRDTRIAAGYDIDAKNQFGSSVMDGQMNQEQLDRGYRLDQMDPTEPMYTGEPYYDIAKIRREKLDIKGMNFYNTDEGFCERNNFMDRN